MTWQLKRLKSMKLPLAKLSPAKLRSLKPFKGIAKKLSAEKARFARTSEPTRVQKGKSASRIALTLLLVRPWVLVLGFWIFSMGIGTLALGGMLSPRKLTTALPESTVDASVAGSSQSADTLTAAEATSESATVEDADVENSSAAGPNQTNSSGLALALPMFLLVSACAVGCFAISRQRAMKMASARARVRKARGSLTITTAASPRAGSSKASRLKANGSRPSGRKLVGTADSVRPVRKAPVRQPTLELRHKTLELRNRTPELRSKKRRQRSKTALLAQTAAKPTANGGKVLVSRATAVRAGAQSRQAQTQLRKGAIRAASRRRRPMEPNSASQTSIVSVVPASESHALDWREGSLAHQMDIRPHRSAM